MTPKEIEAIMAEAAAQAEQTPGTEPKWRPKIPIYLDGPKPYGGTWCSTCAVLWLGHLSNDPAMQKWIRKLHDQAVRDGLANLIAALPEHDDKLPILQQAVTVGPSVYSDTPMPTCWTHLKPYRFLSKEETTLMEKQQYEKGGTRSPIIPGKAYWSGNDIPS